MISATARVIAVLIDAVFPLLKLPGIRGNRQSNSFDPRGLVALEFPFSSWAFSPFFGFFKELRRFF
jgi:hypothetical protein